MRKLVLLSLVLSVLFVSVAFYGLRTMTIGPFFIESESVLASFRPVQLANRNIELMDADFNAGERAYSDSVIGLYDSTSTQTEYKKNLVELLNMERQVYSLKKRDSIVERMHRDLKASLELFNQESAVFCERNSIPVLFSSNENSVVYGLNTKADLSDELKIFFGGRNE